MSRAAVQREQALAVAVLDCLLRENYGGLADRVRPGPSLSLPGRPAEILLPLTTDGFLADLRIDAGTRVPRLSLADVDAVLGAVADPRDTDGVAAFRAECRAALDAPVSPGLPPDPRSAGSLDAAVAKMPHPAYPTWQARTGFTAADARRYGPEFAPEFELRWVAIPRTAVTLAGHPTPSWWPTWSGVGLPESLAATHVLFPVHPVTARRTLADALTEAGLAGAARTPGARADGAAVCAPLPWLRVRPTLSVRTVALTGQARAHLKLPLPVSTLGLRNRRAIAPGTLADGALVHAILDEAAGRDAELAGLLLADDASYAHAGHRYLGYLLRALPDGLDGHPVPVAGLLAPAGPGGRLLIDDLAGGGDLLGFFRGYLDLVFGIAVALFVRYGIALESHQQNAAVVASSDGRPRLLVKDFDGTLINHARLAAALGPAAPEPDEFADQRLLTGSDDALADVFITITVHLCAGAIAFGLARLGRAPLPVLLRAVRDALNAALDRYRGDPAAALLRARVLAADRLPGKAMVTAGTLTEKARTGAADINKYYGTSGPNYLRSTS